MELEQKYELQAAKHEDLTREMSRLRQISSTADKCRSCPATTSVILVISRSVQLLDEINF